MMPACGSFAPDTRSFAVQIVYFTLVAAILYLLANWIVERIEVAAGRRFEYRSLLFFAILLTLALVSFGLIRNYTGNP